MNFAIIAAGEGSRLAAGGINVPKPLVQLCGVPLIDRLTDILVKNGASSISVIVNEQNTKTVTHLQGKSLPVPLNLVIKTTSGSMHSLYELSPFLKGADFCLMTVDTVFCKNDFADYIADFRRSTKYDGLMAVTDFIDDESPLYAGVDDHLNITGYYDVPQDDSRYISGGIYCLRNTALNVLEKVMKQGMTRMRDFQRQMVAAGLKLKAFPFPKIVDIDHPEDIKTAEEFLYNSSICNKT
ncbi:MAG: NDP-sugar synthase [Bacteroidales bacterium]|jgi:NDP-sugar pyrophosphorylase family protein|nr:NDP-sugar synthase [Bacteroidales bacterium]